MVLYGCTKHKWQSDTQACQYCKTENEDIINKPNHYHKGGIDLFSFGEQKFSKEEMHGFYKLNVMKYLTRVGKKDNVVQDLKKAERYLQQLIKLEEGK
jgi:protein-arginine kinase activator protein McsA